MFGGVTVVTGVLGSVAGGVALDRMGECLGGVALDRMGGWGGAWSEEEIYCAYTVGWLACTGVGAGTGWVHAGGGGERGGNMGA